MEDTTTVHPPEPAAVRRLVRAREGRWFGGVAAGLGRYFDVNAAIYRIVFGALAFAGGAGILLYLAAWLVIPDEGEDASVAEQALRDHRERPALAIGVGLLAFAALIVLSHATLWPDLGSLWLVALLVGGGLVWWELRRSRPAVSAAGRGSAPTAAADGSAPAPAARAPHGPSLFLPVVGVLLATAGVFGVLEALDVSTVDLRIVLAGAVVLVGAAVVAGAATAWRVSGLIGLGLILLVALVLSLAIDVPLRGGVGDRVENPVTASEIDRAYHLAVGQLTLDLRDVQVTEPTRVTVEVGVGEALVYVPRDASLVLDGHAGAGAVDLLGRQDEGLGADRHVVEEGSGPTLVLTTRVGVGSIEVRRR